MAAVEKSAAEGTFQQKIFLGLILILAAAVRLPGVFWGQGFFQGIRSFRVYDIDENTLVNLFWEFNSGTPNFDTNYPKAFGLALSTFHQGFERLLKLFAVVSDSPLKNIHIQGRLVSLLFGVGLVWLIYLMARLLSRDRRVPLYAALFLALAGLPVTQSHLCTADSMNAFMIFLSLYFFLRSAVSQSSFFLVLGTIAAGWAFGTKLSLVELVPLPYLFHRFWTQKGPKWTCILMALCWVVLVVAVLLSNGLHSNRQTLNNIIYNLRFDNLYVKRHNKLLNPFFYTLFMLPGVGLLSYLAAVYSLAGRRKVWRLLKSQEPAFFIILLPMMAHLFVISQLSIPNMRHALPLAAFFCILAGFGFSSLLDRWPFLSRNRFLVPLLAFVICYQGIYVASTEYYFVRDLRAAAFEWVQANLNRTKPIYIAGFYDWMPSRFPFPRVDAPPFAQILLLDDSLLRRYRRSALNPLTDCPDCGSEVFHSNYAECAYLQAVFRNDTPFHLIKTFAIEPWTPELMLYRHYWGNFPDFIGDVLIYSRSR